MNFNKSNFIAIFVIAVVFLTSCAKTNYDNSARVQPLATKLQQPPTVPPPAGAGKRAPPVNTENLPNISFVENEVTMDGKLEAHLELRLSAASNQPVTATVNLVNATALHYRDFSGFKTLSSNNHSLAEVTQTVVFPPNTTRMALPVIGGRQTRFCDTYFFAVINSRLQQAQVADDTARINIPCTDVDEPIVAPTPPPRLEPIPCPPAPATEARFEFEKIKTSEHATGTSVKIFLNRVSDLPVVIELETHDGSAYSQLDYVGLKVQVTIQPGQIGVELPIQLITAHRCRARNASRWVREGEFEFTLQATAISNATMKNTSTSITVEKDIDDDRGCLTAP